MVSAADIINPIISVAAWKNLEDADDSVPVAGSDEEE